MQLTGNLLVASTIVDDPVYARGVCLVVHQDEGGVIGVMLNRPMQPNPDALLELLGESPGPTNRLESESNELAVPNLGSVHFGGPLSGPVVAIHQMSQYAEAETGQGIYVAAQKEHLEDLVRDQPCPYRLIVGHLGWASDKLQEEFDAGFWHILPATANVVFCRPEDMWPGLIRPASWRSLSRWIGIGDAAGVAELN